MGIIGVIDKFYSLLALSTALNRLVAPPLAVAILYYSGIEADRYILGAAFVIIAVVPNLLVVTSISLAMNVLGVVHWTWVEAFVPGSALLFLPIGALLVWLFFKFKEEMEIENAQAELIRTARLRNLERDSTRQP